MQQPARAHRAHDSEATREALLGAGLELFAEHGFEGVRVDQIARQAGANKALINYHFGGKAGLYAAILKGTFESMSADLAALRNGNRPADQALREFVGVLGAMMQRRPSLPRMILREILSGGEHMPEDVLPHFISVFETVSGLVARGVRARRFRAVDPFLTHLSLMGALTFFFVTRSFREKKIAELPQSIPAEPRAEDYVAHLQELIVRGLSAEAPRPRAGR
jgi:AcrR family transcriptional regulator